MTGKYLGHRNVPLPSPALFKVSANDILSFPQLIDAFPANWPDRVDDQAIKYAPLVNDPLFCSQKFYIFTKRILLDETIYRAMAEAITNSKKLQNKLTQHKANKTQELHDILISLPEFQKYILDNPKVIDEIVKELEIYNQDFEKEKYKSLRIDTQKVRENFQKLSQEILSKLSDQSSNQSSQLNTMNISSSF